jgi:hypothetical protein
MTMKTGKEGKKGKKGMKKMPLAEFLGNTAVPDGFDKKVVNWADVTEDDDMSGESFDELLFDQILTIHCIRHPSAEV